MRAVLTVLMLLALSETSKGASPTTDDYFFERKIRPLLETHCLECHGAEKNLKGGLSLSHREGWQIGGDSGPAIDLQEPRASLILKAVGYHDRDLKMPPKQKLSEAEITDLRQWIESGAPDPRVVATAKVESKTSVSKKLWSFQPVSVPTEETVKPLVKDSTWPRDAVDHHILRELEMQGLSPVEDANPEALLRRVYFDLTGLPPEPEVFESFEVDQLPALVDRLMATPAFAERWAQHWLDITRFAESSGGGRSLPFKDAWRFRDYVIESILKETPMNRFISEQIAGDLMNADHWEQRRKQIIATSFLTLGPTNYEEQDKSLLRMDIVDEQLDTLGRAFMGMTLGCARCHDHKFDPVSIRDYYALAGILKNTHTLKNYTDNVAKWVEVSLPVESEVESLLQAKETKLAELSGKLSQVEVQLKKLAPKVSAMQAAGALDAKVFPGKVLDDTQAEFTGAWTASVSTKDFISEGYRHDANEGKGLKMATFAPQLDTSGVYEVRLAYSSSAGRAKRVRLEIFHADGKDEVILDQSAPPPIHGRFASLGKFRFEKDGATYVKISNADTRGHVTVDALWLLDDKALKEEQAELVKSDAEQRQLMLQEKEALMASRTQLMEQSPQREQAMSIREEAEPEDSPILIRGNIRNLGPVVPRGFIEAVPLKDIPAIPQGSSGRLELAQWVTHDQNPLTARVLVNRVWMHLFGEGLVRSVDNFGSTGELPSHPLLLDHLAHDFVKEGWSLKKLIRRLILTRTYQLASVPKDAASWAKAQTMDPDNHLLWRAHRRRLDVHAMRDSMLVAGGNLDPSFLGANVTSQDANPNSETAQDLEYFYVFKDARRSVYTPAFRNRRLEIFEAFDFADINSPIGQRTRSVIAPQALYFLNHPFVLQQSLKAAQQLQQQFPQAPQEVKIQHLWRKILGRAPSPAEAQKAANFLVNVVESESSKSEEVLAQLVQALFASADFRYLD